MSALSRTARLLVAGVCFCRAQTVLAADGARYPYQSCFEIASRMHSVDLDLVLAVAATESNWDADARSDANAHGIMQIQWPGTARRLGVRRPAELYNPCLNITLGARYLRELLDQFGGDTERALAAYNYGPTRIARSPELPAGARRYAARVFAHRQRISQSGSSWVSLRKDHELIRFTSSQRASRYARMLASRIENAMFETSRRTDGMYVVTMAVKPAGLSLRDTINLETLVGGEPGS